MQAFKKFRNSDFYKITFGSLLAQIIVIAASPLTTRLYSPEQLGNYTLIISIISLVLPVVSLKFDTLIITDRKQKEMAVYISLILMFVVSAVTFIFGLFYLKGSQSVIWSLILLAILILSGINNVGISLANSESEYQIIGNFNFIKSLIQNLFLLFFGLVKFDVIGMLFSQLLGSFSGTIRMFRESNFHFSINSIPRTKEIIKFIRKNINLIRYSAPAYFVNSLSYNILNFFISGLFGAEVFGFYSLAFRILGMPLTVISQNFSKVFFKDASDEWEAQGSFRKSLLKHSIILFSIAVVFLLGAVILGPLIFKIVFGSAWETTGEYVQILAPMFAVRLVVSSLTPAFLIANKQNNELFFQSILLITAVIGYGLTKILHLRIVMFLIIISILYSAVYIMFYFKIYKISKGRLKND